MIWLKMRFKTKEVPGAPLLLFKELKKPAEPKRSGARYSAPSATFLCSNRARNVCAPGLPANVQVESFST